MIVSVIVMTDICDPKLKRSRNFRPSPWILPSLVANFGFYLLVMTRSGCMFTRKQWRNWQTLKRLSKSKLKKDTSLITWLCCVQNGDRIERVSSRFVQWTCGNSDGRRNRHRSGHHPWTPAPGWVIRRGTGVLRGQHELSQSLCAHV